METNRYLVKTERISQTAFECLESFTYIAWVLTAKQSVFFLKISKKKSVKRGVRVLRARSLWLNPDHNS